MRQGLLGLLMAGLSACAPGDGQRVPDGGIGGTGAVQTEPCPEKDACEP